MFSHMCARVNVKLADALLVTMHQKCVVSIDLFLNQTHLLVLFCILTI